MKKYHIDQNGNKTLIAELETGHLKNIIHYIERKAKVGVLVQRGGGGVFGPSWYEERIIKGQECLEYLGYKAYVRELKMRQRMKLEDTLLQAIDGKKFKYNNSILKILSMEPEYKYGCFVIEVQDRYGNQYVLPVSAVEKFEVIEKVCKYCKARAELDKVLDILANFSATNDVLYEDLGNLFNTTSDIACNALMLCECGVEKSDRIQK